MKTISLTLIFCLSASVFPLAAQTYTGTAPEEMPATSTQLLDGTPVKLRLGRDLSSKDAKTGESVDFEVIEDIKVGDITVIPAGGTAIGTVTRAKPRGRLGRGGKLDITIDYARTALGEKVALRAVKESKGDNRTGRMTTAIVASGILFFPAAPLFLFLKGRNINLPKGTEVTAYVSGDTPLDLADYAAAEIVREVHDETAPAVSVSFISDPEGADILIDGNFVGNTPSSVPVTPGEHTIVIEKPGYKKWDRSIRIDPGSSITLNATLDPQ